MTNHAALIAEAREEARQEEHVGHYAAENIIRRLANALEALQSPAPAGWKEEPIPMVLHCPACGLQHIDAPESEDKPSLWTYEDDGRPARWENPPHRSHLCADCGHIWRPADVPTTGVSAVQTHGKDDSPIASPQPPATAPISNAEPPNTVSADPALTQLLAPWRSFRKKPVALRAYQFTQAMVEAHLFDGEPLPEGLMLASANYHRKRREVHSARFVVTTMHGDRATVAVGDWVVPEPVADRYYPVDPEVFSATYDAVEAAESTPGGGSAHLNTPATAGDGWRDIASAPRDGTWVLLHSPKWPITCYPLVGWSDGPGEEWQFPAHPQWAPEMPWPTHWMMLPAPPAPVLSDAGEEGK